jgi:hypothetical protein
VVFDSETGRQLEVPLSATVDDLIEHGCPAGRYRLEAVDGSGRVIPTIVAVTEIPEGVAEPEEDPRSTEPAVARLLQTVERQTDTLCRALEAMANAFGPVRPAPMPTFVAPPPEESMRPDQLVQTVATVAKSVADAWKTNHSPGGET